MYDYYNVILCFEFPVNECGSLRIELLRVSQVNSNLLTAGAKWISHVAVRLNLTRDARRA